MARRRVLETDPVHYADQMNLYAYVGNDPLNATDPTGEQMTAENLSIEETYDPDGTLTAVAIEVNATASTRGTVHAPGVYLKEAEEAWTVAPTDHEGVTFSMNMTLIQVGRDIVTGVQEGDLQLENCGDCSSDSGGTLGHGTSSTGVIAVMRGPAPAGVAGHEVDHAMGLGHEKPGAVSIMLEKTPIPEKATAKDVANVYKEWNKK